MKECISLTKPGGRIVHATPCFSYVFDFSPVHLHFVSSSGLENLSKKHGLLLVQEINSDMTLDKINLRYMCRIFKQDTLDCI